MDSIDFRVSNLVRIEEIHLPSLNIPRTVTHLLFSLGVNKYVKVFAVGCVAARAKLDFDRKFNTHVGIAHTRWATHGEPSWVNTHPHRSDVNCGWCSFLTVFATDSPHFRYNFEHNN
jgi:hypothetical protein